MTDPRITTIIQALDSAYMTVKTYEDTVAAAHSLAADAARAQDAEQHTIIYTSMQGDEMMDRLRADRAAAVARAEQAERALVDLTAWANRMPDAGLTVDDPRYQWYVERPCGPASTAGGKP